MKTAIIINDFDAEIVCSAKADKPSTMAYKPWAIAYKLWAMAYKLWAMAYKLWAIAYKLWAMAYKPSAMAYKPSAKDEKLFSTNKTLLSLTKIKFVLALMITLFITSCEKDITVNFPPPPNLIVVDGHIEPGQYAYVHLTKNSSYFAPTDTATLISYLITNATVVVSDGVIDDTLKFTLDLGNFPYFPFVYKGSKIIGQANHFYSLKVIANGQTITATTSIPKPVVPDSAWFQPQGTLDSLGFVWIHFKDPDTLGNCYRFMTKRISHRPDGTVKDKDFLTDINSVFGDKIFNGTSPTFSFDRGHIPYDTAADEHNIEAGYFVKGDTIIFKFISIDRPHFDFWTTEGIAAENSGNPFAAPISVKSNIIGGLGIWGGYGAAYDTVIAK